MKKFFISPSLMCSNLMNAGSDIKTLEGCGADFLHIDVMDNHFVPNITLGPDFARAVRKTCGSPIDVHLMVENPENCIACWNFLGEGDIISVHYESSRHVQKALAAIRELGARPGIALNPATPFTLLGHVLDDIDVVLVMTVNPGFAGQRLIPAALEKIQALRLWLDERGRGDILIEADGNVSFDSARSLKEAGADIFVAGSSSVFSPEGGVAENYARLKNMLKNTL
ncbi:MAG: ribulose-phosphate 3-epimerase [Spirochaetales bacterium]|jgi:ribulose-phosphate 3-epimerase|nr:ribulose-phosphate 3-epimerase [Spirochaetales bacterium]